MSSSEYWAKRFLQLAETQFLSDAELVKNLEKLYKQAQADIESKISRWYMKFAENNEISMADAKKLLKADELEEFKWTVEEYIQHGENNIDDSFTKQLVNASSKVHISRYEALLTELRQTAEKIMSTQESKLTEHLKTAYSENYLHTAFEIQKGTGVGAYLGGVDDRSLAEIIKKPWAADGSNFSERIWKDRNSLVSELDIQLKRNIALGKGPDDATKAISKRFETSKSNAYRLVMTESAAISAKATKQCYDDLEVEDFEVLETLDSHTCEICGVMDGKHFPKSQYEIGVTVPPFHPRCRGTTIPYFDDMEGYGERAARDFEGNTFYVPTDTTYEQWKQMQDEKYGAGSVDKARQMAYNKSADLKQYEKYQTVLKELTPDMFEDFRELKYNKTSEWQILQKKYRIANTYKIDSGDLSPTKLLQLDDVVISEKRNMFTSKYKKSGNIAGAYIDDNMNNMFFAHSLISDTSKGYNGNSTLVLLKDNRRFSYIDVLKQDGSIRSETYNDTEAKLFEYFADVYEQQPFDSITMLSERGMCDSCKGVMKQFHELYPDVIINVVSNTKVEGNVWKDRRKRK